MIRLDELLLQCGMDPVSPEADNQFSAYLELLLKWNKKLNLTSIRTTEEILQRHFVESIFCARHLPKGVKTLLDIGSGGGFPGVPIAICRPEIVVTLAESQGKKAAFLRETVRTLRLSADVHGGRAESLTAQYDAVTLRAVDRMADAVSAAVDRLAGGGYIALMIGAEDSESFKNDRIAWEIPVLMPNSEKSMILMGQRTES
jgi:16S rRNA (guanine527-N7)-methyltransferase